MKQLRLPTVDHFEPSASQLREAVAFIEQQRVAGHRVYVHCKAGHGRAASVALAWLLYTNPDMSSKDANAFLRGMRKVRAALYQQRNVIEFQQLLAAESEAQKKTSSGVVSSKKDSCEANEK
jgi:atypical dual specificity phosphatase